MSAGDAGVSRRAALLAIPASFFAAQKVVWQTLLIFPGCSLHDRVVDFHPIEFSLVGLSASCFVTTGARLTVLAS